MDDLDVCLGKGYDLNSGEHFSEWKSRDGRMTPINEMADEHIVNAINYVRRRYNPMSECHEGSKMSMFTDGFVEQAGNVLADRFAKVLSHVRSMIDSPRYKSLWKEALKRGLVDEDN